MMWQTSKQQAKAEPQALECSLIETQTLLSKTGPTQAKQLWSLEPATWA